MKQKKLNLDLEQFEQSSTQLGSRKSHYRWLWFFVLLFSLFSAGCAGSIGGGLNGFLVVFVATFLFAAGCSQVITSKPDGIQTDGVQNDGSVEPDKKKPDEVQDDGSVEPDKKKPDVREQSRPDKRVEPPLPDKKQPDGRWEKCCKNGQVSKCFCPGGMACNYGMYQDCGAGICVSRGGACGNEKSEKPDAGSEASRPDKRIEPPRPDRRAEPSRPDKRAEPSRPDKRVEPSRPDKRVEPSRPDKKQPDGHWQKCCRSGQIDKCFCPNGMACNYGMYQDCGGGVCVGRGQKCSP